MIEPINLNADGKDLGKQITALKTYVQQMRDQVDDELHSIGFEQLNRDLQKRISGLDESIKLTNEMARITAENITAKYLSADFIRATYMTADEIQATYITADEVTTNYLNAQQIAASYATIGSLNAVSARVGTVEANYISASTVAANYATISSLGAAEARIGTIEANYITASAITAEYLNSKFSGSNGLQASRIYCDNYHVNAEGQSYMLTPRRLVVGSNSLIILGA